jgi:ABC-type branched-subunit amino acid transport system ATPase component
MTTKLTLTVEKEIIEKSKSFAKKTGTSLSNIVENYLTTIVEEKQEAQVSEKLSKIVGKVKLPDNFDEKGELLQYLEKKHL